MKKLAILIYVYLIFGTLLSSAQIIVNNGSDIYISEGSNLIMTGDFENLLDGSIENSGDIHITGDWINNTTSGNLLQNTTGSVIFYGTETQYISGIQKTWFNILNLHNNVELETEISVSTELNFSNALLNIVDADIMVESGAEISGIPNSGYVVAENSGFVKRVVENIDIEFPLGTISSYVPLVLNNSGVVDTFGVNVFNDVLENGLSGNTITEIDHCVNNTWNISEQTPGGSNLSVTAAWETNLEGLDFNRNHCGLGHYFNNNWEPQKDTVATGNNPFSITRSGITALSAFAVGDTSSPMAVALRLTVDITIFLQGPFNGTDMNTDLNPENIPLSQPFNTSPWNYEGLEYVDFIPNTNVIDWVLIELRDTTEAPLASGETMIARQAAFLMNSGQIVGLEGSILPRFEASISNNLFVVIWHRNHLSIMSANPVPQTGDVYNYDYTTPVGQAYGTDAQKDLGGGVYGMISADANADGHVNTTDKTIWENQAGTKGYKSADFNMNGQVNNPDKNNLMVPDFGENSQVPE